MIKDTRSRTYITWAFLLTAMAACCPNCKRDYTVSRTEACGAPICELVAHTARFQIKYGELPNNTAHIEPKLKRGEADVEFNKKTRNLTPWPQAEFEKELNTRLAKLFEQPPPGDSAQARAFVASANKREFVENWLSASFDADYNGYYVADRNKTGSVMNRIRGTVEGIWPDLVANTDLERLRVEANVARARRILDRAEQAIKFGRVPSTKDFEAGPAGIGQFEPIEHISSQESVARELMERTNALGRQRDILVQIDEQGLEPLFTAAASLYRANLIASRDIFAPFTGRDRAVAFLSSPQFGAELTRALAATLGEARGQKMRVGFDAVTRVNPETGQAYLPGLAEELVNGLSNIYEEVRLQRYNEFTSALLPKLAAKIKELSIQRGQGSVADLRDSVVMPFLDTPAGQVGRSMTDQDVTEIIRDSIMMYARAGAAKTQEEKAKAAPPEVVKEATVKIKPVAKPSKKASKYRSEFVEAVVERIKLEPSGGDSGWKTIKAKDNAAMVAWLTNAALPKTVAESIGIPESRYSTTILAKDSFLGGKIRSAIERYSKEERAALASKTAQEKERLKQEKAAASKAKAEADKAAREQERKLRQAERTARAQRVMEQVVAWPEEGINVYLSNLNEVPQESRKVIEIYKQVVETGGAKGVFQSMLTSSGGPGGMPVLPSDTDLGIEPHNLAWAKLEASMLGKARRRKAVSNVLDKMNIEVARAETFVYGLPDPDVYDAYMDAMAKINKVDRRSLDYTHERPALDPEKPEAIAKLMYKKRTQKLLQELPIELTTLSNGATKEAQLAQLGLIARESLPIIEAMVAELEKSPANRFQSDKALVELQQELDGVLAELDDGKMSANRIEGAFLEVGRNNLKGFKDKLLANWLRFDSQIASALTDRDASTLVAHRPKYESIYPRSTLETEQGRATVANLERAYKALRAAKETSDPGVASAILNAIEKDKKAEAEYLRATTAAQEIQRKREEARKAAEGAGLKLPPEPAPAPTVVTKKRITPMIVSVAATPNLPGATATPAPLQPVLPVVVAPPPPITPLALRRTDRALSDIEDDDDLPPIPQPPPEKPFKATDPVKEQKEKVEEAFDQDAKEELEDESIDLDFEPGKSDDEEDEGDEEEDIGAIEEKEDGGSAAGKPTGDVTMRDASSFKPLPSSQTDPLEAVMRRLAKGSNPAAPKKKQPSFLERLKKSKSKSKEDDLDGWLADDTEPLEMTAEETAAYYSTMGDPKQKAASDLIQFNM